MQVAQHLLGYSSFCLLGYILWGLLLRSRWLHLTQRVTSHWAGGTIGRLLAGVHTMGHWGHAAVLQGYPEAAGSWVCPGLSLLGAAHLGLPTWERV
jgi:hypothetical protein